MKKKISLLTILIYSIAFSQTEADGIIIEKSFFKFEKGNTKVGMTFGFDYNPTSENGKSGVIIPKGSLLNEHLRHYKSGNISVGFDIYSAESILGFYLAPSLNIHDFTINHPNAPFIDSMATSNLDLPFYFKLRIGKILKRDNITLAFGGGYSIPLMLNREFIEKSTDRILNIDRDETNIFNSTPYISTILGWEIIIASQKKSGEHIYDRDDFRLLIYTKANYDLDNRINPNFDFGFNTSLGHYTNPSLRFLKFGFGIIIQFRFSKAGYVFKETLKTIYEY